MQRFIAILLLVLQYGIQAQKELNFKRYTIEDGLPASYVLNIYQDHVGFMWFGMRGGCCRFDGIKFESFKVHLDDGYEEIDTWVVGIGEDKNNRLWVVENGQFGLLLFDPQKEVFISYADKLNLPDTGQKNIPVNTFYCDSKGFLWLGILNYGIIRFDPVNEQSFHMPYVDGEENSVPFGAYRSITEDDNGDVWIATSRQLVRFHYNSNQFVHSQSLQHKNVLSVFNDSDKKLWLAVYGKGLLDYDKSTDSYTTVFNEYTTYNIIAEENTFVKNEGANKLWIGTNNGIIILDREKEIIQKIKHNENNPNSINSNIVKDIFFDKAGAVWIGTSDGICHLKSQHFKSYSYSASKNSISQNRVLFITESFDEKIWVATPIGIDLFDRQNEKFTFLAGHNSTDNTGISKASTSFCNHFDKGMWIGTYGGGLNYYNYSTKEFKYFPLDTSSDNALNNPFIFTLFLDKSEKLWIGTWGGGINIYDLKTKKFTSYLKEKGDSSSLPSNYVRCIYKGAGERIWIGTLDGIAWVEDIYNRNFHSLFHNRQLNIKKQLDVFSILESQQGNFLWFGTRNGLYCFDIKRDTFRIYDKKDGLPSLKIFGIVEDDKKNLWLSTSNGLVKAKPEYKNGVKDITFFNYSKSDGLQGNEFLPGSFCKLKDGSVIFGGTSGFNIFHPDSLKIDTMFPPIVFSGIEIENGAVKIGQRFNGQVVLDSSISNKKSLTIIHRNNNFNISFVALEYIQPEKINYAYKLLGFDKEWNTVGYTNRKASYMNLPGGNYIFKVKASNVHGLWNNNYIQLQLQILPPWWRTWWFAVILVLVLSSGILFIVRQRTTHLETQKQILEKTVHQRTAELKDANIALFERKEELEQQMEKISEMNKKLELQSRQVESMAKKLHEADQQKLRFFANISHEFRTPLSIIIAPLEKLISTHTIDGWVKMKITNVKLILRNAYRLNNLINQIVDFRKMDQKQCVINVTNNNILDFIVEVIDAFKPIAEAKGIQLLVKSEELRVKNEEQSIQSMQLITHHSSLITQFWFDPDIMEKILYNLISNAIKYTPEGGEINIQLRVKSEELRVEDKKNINENSPLFTHHSSLIIKVSDTGIGISTKHIDKIFDRFYRVETRHGASLPENQPEGTGIGLSYTKELVNLHKGTISVSNNVGAGTTFFLTFPFLPSQTCVKKGNAAPNSESSNIALHYIQSMVKNESGATEFSGQKNSCAESLRLNESFKSILITEDNNELRNIISDELSSHYNIIEAINGEMAFKLATSCNPDIILSDIMMPVMDGVELCSKLKRNENTSHIPVILITAKTGEDEMIKGLKTGADDYITKPFKFSILKLKIKNLLKTRQILREKYSSSILESDIKEVTTSAIDEEFMRKATEIVKENIDNFNFSNNEFVKSMSMSRSLIYKKMKAITGKSVSEFIRTIRLETASRMLVDSNKNISEIAYAVGFKHRENFTKYFTPHFGLSPSDFIKSKKSK